MLNTTRRCSPLMIGIASRGINPNLADLIRELESLIDRQGLSQTRIVVVINNSDGEVLASVPRSVTLKICRELGYASARNAVLSCRKTGEGVLFIDDDELPHDSWVTSHLDAESEFGEAVYIGAVESVTEYTREPLFDARLRRSHNHGERLNFATTGNMYIPSTVFESTEVSFDNYFNAGGEDTDLALRMRRRGIPTRWNQNAIVYELTPDFRRSDSWKLDREAKALSIYLVAGRRNFGPVWLLSHLSILIVSNIIHRCGSLTKSKKERDRLRIARVGLRAILSGRLAQGVTEVPEWPKVPSTKIK